MSLVSEIKKMISEQKKERVKNTKFELSNDWEPYQDYHESHINTAKINVLEHVLKLIK